MINRSELEDAIKAALPPADHAQVPALSQAIIDLLNRPINLNNPNHSVSIPPSLITPINSLKGQELPAGRNVVTFGNNGQYGDITIRDVAGNILHFNITTEAKEQPQRVVLNSGIMIGSWFLGAIAVLAYSLFALGFVFGVSDLYAPAFLIGIMYAVLTKLSNNEVEPLGSAIAGATTAAIAGAVLIYSRLESYGGVTSWFINNITALSFQMGIIGGLSGFIAGLIAKRIK